MGSFFDQFFRPLPPDIDLEAIRQAWQAIRPPYQINERQLPLPVWARRGLDESGEQAWAVLSRDVVCLDVAKPFCIYVHIPFCAARCAFCDCYSFKLGQHQGRHIETYLNLLDREMSLWSRQGNLGLRPVSTIHFGGGTPTFLGAEPFGRLAASCREYFRVGPQTEWALESTAFELNDSMFSVLDSLGFTRLHIGVQSLQDQVRRNINRREPANVVLEKIAGAVSMGWIVSVDLIYGLPGQSLEGLLNDIHTLAAAGVDGFSLYELQLSPHNRRFTEQHHLANRDRLVDYFLFQAASQLLAFLGYRKTLFNHFARARDANLYFTFPERGEDCLAVGTIADGVFGDYHYRHPEYKAYRSGVNETFPGLQGGLRRNATENRLHPLEVSILSARMQSGLFDDVLGKARAQGLFQHWQEAVLIEKDKGGNLNLTANGSWFAGEMMAQLV
ncbi:MAG: radical SAM protein [Anaerolineae bacterium]|nr:radical SAM protein [Anaerolineae bacterium]